MMNENDVYQYHRKILETLYRIAANADIEVQKDLEGTRALVSLLRDREKIDPGDALILSELLIAFDKIAAGDASNRNWVVKSAPLMIKVLTALLPYEPREEDSFLLCNLAVDLTILVKKGELSLYSSDPALRLNQKSFSMPELNNPWNFFSAIYKEVERLSKSEQKESVDNLKRLASSLFEKLFPVEIRRELLRVSNKVRSVLIQCDNPWIPWELLRMPVDDEREYAFFCEIFESTRWFAEVPLNSEVRCTSLCVLAPNDSNLSQVAKELDMLIRLKEHGIRVNSIPANTESVLQTLRKADFDILHFVGHGSFYGDDADKSAIRLENNEEIIARDITAEYATFLRQQPLVFFNACQTARETFSITGTAGWAQELIRRGEDRSASAFVGTQWSVRDEAALAFASEFYKRFLCEGIEICRSVRLARQAAAEVHFLSSLAYTVYAHPLCVSRRG